VRQCESALNVDAQTPFNSSACRPCQEMSIGNPIGRRDAEDGRRIKTRPALYMWRDGGEIGMIGAWRPKSLTIVDACLSPEKFARSHYSSNVSFLLRSPLSRSLGDSAPRSTFCVSRVL
jgi:hypothetical protein